MITWLKYKRIIRQRNLWENFNILGISENGIKGYYAIGLKLIGIGLSFLLFFGASYVINRILGISFVWAWMFIYTFYFIYEGFIVRRQIYPLFDTKEKTFYVDNLHISPIKFYLFVWGEFIFDHLRTTILATLGGILGASVVLEESWYFPLVLLIIGVMSLVTTSLLFAGMYALSKKAMNKLLYVRLVLVAICIPLVIFLVTKAQFLSSYKIQKLNFKNIVENSSAIFKALFSSSFFTSYWFLPYSAYRFSSTLNFHALLIILFYLSLFIGLGLIVISKIDTKINYRNENIDNLPYSLRMFLLKIYHAKDNKLSSIIFRQLLNKKNSIFEIAIPVKIIVLVLFAKLFLFPLLSIKFQGSIILFILFFELTRIHNEKEWIKYTSFDNQEIIFLQINFDYKIYRLIFDKFIVFFKLGLSKVILLLVLIIISNIEYPSKIILMIFTLSLYSLLIMFEIFKNLIIVVLRKKVTDLKNNEVIKIRRHFDSLSSNISIVPVIILLIQNNFVVNNLMIIELYIFIIFGLILILGYLSLLLKPIINNLVKLSSYFYYHKINFKYNWRLFIPIPIALTVLSIVLIFVKFNFIFVLMTDYLIFRMLFSLIVIKMYSKKILKV